MRALTVATFDDAISGGPILVDFWAPWCGPCRALAPTLERLEGDYEGQLEFAKLNIDQARSVWERFQLRGIPALILFYQGEAVGTSLGALPRGQIADFLDSKLAEIGAPIAEEVVPRPRKKRRANPYGIQVRRPKRSSYTGKKSKSG